MAKKKKGNAADGLYAVPADSETTYADSAGVPAGTVRAAETARELVAALFATDRVVSVATSSLSEAFTADGLLARAMTERDLALALYCLAYPAANSDGSLVVQDLTRVRSQARSGVYAMGVEESLRYVRVALAGTVAFGSDSGKDAYRFSNVPSGAGGHRALRYSKATADRLRDALRKSARLVAEVANKSVAAFADERARGNALDITAQTVVAIFLADPTARALQATGIYSLSDEAAYKAYLNTLLAKQNDAEKLATVIRSVMHVRHLTKSLSGLGILGRISPAIASVTEGILGGFAVLKDAKIFTAPAGQGEVKINEEFIGWAVRSFDYQIATEFDDEGRVLETEGRRHITAAFAVLENDELFPDAATKAAGIERYTPAGFLWLCFDHVAGRMFFATDRAATRPVWEDTADAPEMATLFGITKTSLVIGATI